MFYNFTVCLPEDENTGRCRLPSSFFSTRNSVNSWVRITTCSSILYCRAWPLTHTDSTNIVQADSTTSIPTESNLEPGTCQVDFITEKISPLKSLEIEIIESKTSFKTITLYLIGKLVSKDAIVSLTIPNLETRVKLTSEFGVITSSTKISLKQVNKVLYNPINIPPGLEAQFESLNQVIAFPLIYARLFEKLNVKPQKGVLVSGPAGVGKTSLITAIIEIHGLKLITLNGPDIYSSQLGESESKLREIFSQAESTPGTVLFIDEIVFLNNIGCTSSNTNNQQ